MNDGRARQERPARRAGSRSERQELIRVQPTVSGTYTIRVYSYSGAGSYYFDVSTR